MLQNAPEEREIGLDAANEVFVEGAPHAGNGGFTIGSIGHQLGEHGIVVERHSPALVDAAILADSRPAGLQQPGNFAGRGKEVVFGVFGVDAAFDSMSADGDIFLTEGQLFAGGNAQLEMDEIEAGDQFGDGMLHLQAGIHLQEVEVAVGVYQEFDGTGIGVASRLRGLDSYLSHAPAQVFIDDGGRRFLNDFLMPPLNGALALAKIHHMAVLIAEHLDLDVAGIFDVLLEIDLAVIEGALGFALGGLKG